MKKALVERRIIPNENRYLPIANHTDRISNLWMIYTNLSPSKSHPDAPKNIFSVKKQKTENI